MSPFYVVCQIDVFDRYGDLRLKLLDDVIQMFNLFEDQYTDFIGQIMGQVIVHLQLHLQRIDFVQVLRMMFIKNSDIQTADLTLYMRMLQQVHQISYIVALFILFTAKRRLFAAQKSKCITMHLRNFLTCSGFPPTRRAFDVQEPNYQRFRVDRC